MLFHIPQKSIPILKLTISGSIIERVTQFKFLGLNIDSNLNWRAHLSAVSTKVSRVIGLLHKLKYMFPSYILRMIYNSFILPHFNYSLKAWGCKCQNIEIAYCSHRTNFKSNESFETLRYVGPTHATFLSFITNCIKTDYPRILKILFQSMANRTTIFETVTFIYLIFDVSLVN